MKKYLSIFIVIVFGLVLTGCLPNTQKVDQKDEMKAEEVSEDDSLEVIEEELDDTELEEFETELDALDEEINQL